MANVAVQLTIGDYAKWRATFEKHKDMRIGAAITNERVYRNADNGNEVLIWADAAEVAKARQMFASQELRTAMQESGVVGPPKVHFIE